MKPTPEDLKNTWNVLRGDMDPCHSLDIKNRRALAELRLAEYPDLKRWANAIKKASESPFTTGKVSFSNGHFLMGNFDWLIRPDTLVLIEEGTYDSRDHSPKEVVPPENPAPADLSYWDQPKPEPFKMSPEQLARSNEMAQRNRWIERKTNKWHGLTDKAVEWILNGGETPKNEVAFTDQRRNVSYL